jgi:hypothetical protein
MTWSSSGRHRGQVPSPCCGEPLRRAEEAAQRSQGLHRALLGEEVPGIDAVAADLPCAGAPDVERVVRTGADHAARAPEHQQRLLDDPPRLGVRRVVLQIDRGAGAVVLDPERAAGSRKQRSYSATATGSYADSPLPQAPSRECR